MKNNPKLRGYKIVFSTNEDQEYCENILNDAIRELTNRSIVDVLPEMDNLEATQLVKDIHADLKGKPNETH